ncbi:MAG: hypothetical protein ACREQL_02635 [Candidatus Binatia bacterium]
MVSGTLPLVRALRIAVALLGLCATRGAAAPLRVPLMITEPSGTARAAEPVTVGVPLPAGRVRTVDGLWVGDAHDRVVQSQMRVLERWHDGSARWVLVDFLATVGAHETVTYRLRDGRSPGDRPIPGVRTSTTERDYVLATGEVEITVPRTGDVLIASARTGPAPGFGPIAVPTPAVEGAPEGKPRDPSARLETDGPVRSEILLSGRYPSDLAYDARLAVFAGSPVVRLQLTVTSRATRPYSRIRSLPLVIPGRFEAGSIGVGGDPQRYPALPRAHELRQTDASPTSGCTLDGAPCASGDGWVSAQGPAGTALVVRRYFPEEWPQAIRLTASEIVIDLLAGADEPVALGIGAAKTFELWIDFAPGPDVAATARALRHPLVAHPDPAWVVASRALPNAVDRGSPGARDLLPRLETAIGRYLARGRAERWDDGPPVPCEQRTRERERTGTYGALNWGDWNFPGYRDRSEGCDAWGNLEYDLTQVMGLSWVATGARTDWDAFIAAARHYRDVDIIHFAPGHEDLVGFNHPHKASHFAVESPNTVDLGHTWLEGLVTHYRLTGEVRSLEAARGIADVLVRRRYKAGNPRQFGWPMIALAAAYDATSDGQYRDAARSYADVAVAAHQPTPAAGDWKMGILADGLAAVHAMTGEERLRDWLVRYADALVAEASRFEDPRYTLPLGYLAVLAKNPRYRQLGVATVDRMPIGDWGKTLAISGWTAFRILGPLAAQAATQPATPAPAAPRRGSAAGRRRR